MKGRLGKGQRNKVGEIERTIKRKLINIKNERQIERKNES